MLGLNLTINDDDIVDVMGDLYVKSSEALKRLLEELQSVGYEVEDSRNSSWRKRDGVTVEQMEQNGWSMWFAKLPDIRRGKCKSCNSYISTVGIQSHGHTCEVCGEVTYYQVIDGSRVRFEFLNGEQGFFSPQLSMTAKRWDTEEGFLYLYYEFHEGGLFVVSDEQAENYLAENEGLWEIEEEADQKLLKVKYPSPWDREESAIEPYDIFGHHWNHSIVKIWDGKECREYDRLPIPETISIYESWHWSPVPTSPRIHSRILHAARQTDDKGWHHQDGSPWFTDRHWKEMSKFVRHFTELDADAFDAAWPRFRRDGPGGIEDLARFCHQSPIVENQPNIGNTLDLMGKVLSGQSVTQQEIDEGIRGASDPRSPF